MPFTYRHLEIPGLIEIRSRLFEDARGDFVETYHARDFAAAGIVEDFVQDNQSRSKRGVIRGLHFQKEHPQGKLVRAAEGEIFDVAVDLRSGSPTFGRWLGITLHAKDGNQLWIPSGFAHGFLALSEAAVLTYKSTAFYQPDDEGGIRWNDPTLAIAWPDLGIAPLLSPKDEALSEFDPKKKYFQLRS